MDDKPSFFVEQIIAQLDRWNVGWADGVVTYAFFEALSAANADDPDYAGFQAFTSAQRQAVSSIFGMLAEIADLTFVRATDNGGSDNRLTFANSTTMPDYVWGHAAIRYQDGPGEARDPLSSSEVWVNSDGGVGSYHAGSYNFMAMMHEVMHGLGIPHPGDYNASDDGTITYEGNAEYAQDSLQYTVMSYFAASETGAHQGNNFAQTPLLHDILILQHIYGANMQTRTGDTVYGYGSNAGATYDFTLNLRPVLAIWDAGGVDTINMSGANGATIDLREGGFSSMNGLQHSIAVAYGAVIENAVGSRSHDLIYGNDVDNVIDGGSASDRMYGGGGNDTFFVESESDQVFEYEGEGFDVVFASSSFDLSGAFVERVTLTGSGDFYVRGAYQVDEIIGNDGANVFEGAKAGALRVGGKGDDLYFVHHETARVLEHQGEGVDEIFASCDYSLAGTYVENLRLSGDGVRATGNSLDNEIFGNELDNVIDGGRGADIMSGGYGDDVYVVDHIGDQVLEYDHSLFGRDVVHSLVSFTLRAFVEDIVLLGGADLNATGNELNNILTGNAGLNILTGGLGDDTYRIQSAGDRVVERAGEGFDTIEADFSLSLAGLYVEGLTLLGSADLDATGNTLDNRLVGNAGVNILTGGRGDDVYVIQTLGDQVIERAGEGDDEVISRIDFDLAGTYVEALTLVGDADLKAVGNSLSNRLTGNAGSNILDGRQGADLMSGGLGDDTYHVDNEGDRVVELADGGRDQVFASVSFSLTGTEVERLTLTGDADLDAVGNELDNALVGNSGDNELRGGRGADDMAGGRGDDIYFVDDARDRVFESAGQGRDEIRASVTYSLAGRHVEQLTLTGAADIDAIGNTQANILVGNTGVNRLVGGAGNDIYHVQTAGDVAVERTGEGSDHVFASISYDLRGQYIEHLTLVSDADLNAVGNSLANFITGNGGDNRIWGAGGQDRLTGGAGADTFVFLKASESTTALSDRITDLSDEDTIDLSGIDADVRVEGDQAFRFVEAFTGSAGEARLLLSGGMTLLDLDIDGDGRSDFLLRLQGDHIDHANWLL
ncbi:M10 family metallopeptidase C-terminal domain-containing protein [Brevundimonas sp.]|uniref:M10 family metallopeptidase C-terminal domain-containing protein n=1 Tax=Brevundimonas sp. TaxID=1871086 RepID=UPI0035B3C154